MSQPNEHAAVTVAIAGAAGRMGRRLVALASETPGVELVEAFEHPDHEAVGADSGELAGTGPNEIAITEGPTTKADVLIDFTSPAALGNLLLFCSQEDVGLVIGTTGLGAADHAAIDEAAQSVPIVQAPNMSLGVNLLFTLAAAAAKQLGEDYDIEVLEAHHRYKKDAPSGTAMGIAGAICEATGRSIEDDLVYERRGQTGERERGKIGMQTLRMGDVVGEHTAFFAGLGERIELRHVATSRDTFARGALRAAAWLNNKPAGRYDMKDVLGLDG